MNLSLLSPYCFLHFIIFLFLCYFFLFFYFSFIFFWRLITLQYYIGIAIHQHESTTGIHWSKLVIDQFLEIWDLFFKPICLSSGSIQFFQSVFDRIGRVLLKTLRFSVHLNITVLTASFVSCCQPHPASPRIHNNSQEVIHLHLLRTHCGKESALGTSQEVIHMTITIEDVL